MLISELKTLIEEKGEICSSEIFAIIKADKGLIEHALNQLKLKGIIEEVIPQKHCQGCLAQCNIKSEKIYRVNYYHPL